MRKEMLKAEQFARWQWFKYWFESASVLGLYGTMILGLLIWSSSGILSIILSFMSGGAWLWMGRLLTLSWTGAYKEAVYNYGVAERLRKDDHRYDEVKFWLK